MGGHTTAQRLGAEFLGTFWLVLGRVRQRGPRGRLPRFRDAAVLWVIADGVEGFSASESGFAPNGYGDRSPGGYSLLSVLVVEVALTAFFLYVILGATDTRAPRASRRSRSASRSP